MFSAGSEGTGVPGTRGWFARPVESDLALMARVGKGDTRAFAVLVRRHATRLYGVALRMCSDRHEAEDIVQDCFARMWQLAPSWQPSGAGLVGWLYRVTLNLSHDRRRRLRIVPGEDLPDLPDPSPAADRQIEADQAQEALLRALGDLPERYRAALVLCYYEGLSNALAAEVLELNIKAMESLLVRARRQLRLRLEAQRLSAGDLLADETERAA